MLDAAAVSSRLELRPAINADRGTVNDVIERAVVKSGAALVHVC